MDKPAFVSLLGNFSQESQALFAQMTVQPSHERKILINRTIRALKSENIWQKMDALYMLAAHNSQAARLNWKNPGTWTLSEVSSPAFTTDRGYTGDGVAMQLTATLTGTPTNYQSTDASLGAVVLTNSSDGDGDFGLRTSGAALRGAVRVRNGAGISFVRVSGSTAQTGGSGNAPKFISGNRTDGTNQDIYESGVLSATGAGAGAAIGADGVLYVLGDAAATYADRQVGFLYFGGSIGAAGHASANTILKSYFSALGVTLT